MPITLIPELGEACRKERSVTFGAEGGLHEEVEQTSLQSSVTAGVWTRDLAGHAPRQCILTLIRQYAQNINCERDRLVPGRPERVDTDLAMIS